MRSSAVSIPSRSRMKLKLPPLESVADVSTTVGTSSNNLSCNSPATSIGEARKNTPRFLRSSQ